MGRSYRRASRLLAASAGWDSSRLRAYQTDRLRKLLVHAYENVPFYRDAYRGKHLSPADLSDVRDIAQFPTITKAQMRENRDLLVSRQSSSQTVWRCNSGGATGTPLEFVIDAGAYGFEWAFMVRQWGRVGYRAGARKMTLRGRALGDALWEFDPLYNEVVVNVYRLAASNVAALVGVMRRFSPKFLHGYPSALAHFASLVVDAGLAGGIAVPIQAALCGSEALLPHQRALIETAFRTRCYSWYGQSEKVILAGWGATSEAFHIFPEYGVTELLDDAGNVVEAEGQEGELVGTSFCNTVMPFIRYRTGDRAEYGGTPDPELRNYRTLARINGRVGDFVETSDGRRIPLTALIHGQHLPAFARVSSLQVCSPRPGEMVVIVVPLGCYGSGADQETSRILSDALGGGMRLSVVHRPTPVRVASGKAPLLVPADRLEGQ